MHISLACISVHSTNAAAIAIDGDCEILFSMGETQRALDRFRIEVLAIDEKTEISLVSFGLVESSSVLDIGAESDFTPRNFRHFMFSIHGAKSLVLLPASYSVDEQSERRENFVWVTKKGTPYATPCFSASF
jgi:hypothetical protein